MDKLQSLRVYVAVAEAESFAAAARALALSAPAVTRAVASLEANLGVKLLDRTTRYVRVTEAGARYLEDSKAVLARMAAADEAAQGINATPSGHLTVTAPVQFGRRYVLPGILDYLERYPQTQVEAAFLDRVVNMLEEGMDVGVRIGQLPDSSLRARRVGSVRHVLVAAPGYLDRFGAPGSPEDLPNHRTIVSRAGEFSRAWCLHQDGTELRIKIQPRLTVSSNDAAREASVAGFGITRALSYQVADELTDGRLIRVLTDYEPPSIPIHILHREGPYASARVRTFIDLLAERLLRDPVLQAEPKSDHYVASNGHC